MLLLDDVTSDSDVLLMDKFALVVVILLLLDDVTSDVLLKDIFALVVVVVCCVVEVVAFVPFLPALLDATVCADCGLPL